MIRQPGHFPTALLSIRGGRPQEENSMSALTAARPHLSTSLALLLTVAIAVLLLFAVAFDQGQLAALAQAGSGDTTVHEAFHDARHILGFPCH